MVKLRTEKTQYCHNTYVIKQDWFSRSGKSKQESMFEMKTTYV